MRIRLEHIKKQFNGVTVLSDLNLDLASKKFTTLLGSSGCGKTTLLRIIAGLETPDDGTIFFDDQCVFSKTKHINILPEQRGLGFVFQDFALWPHMTVFENVAFGLRATGRKQKIEEQVSSALASVRLSDFGSRYPHQLSGGQQQRVAFARAIAVNPKCILFDEPLSALDAILREEMRTELKLLVAQREITAVFVTHDQLEAMSMSDQIVVMDQGVIQQNGQPEEIYNHPANLFVAKFVGNSNWLDETTMVRPEQVSLTPVDQGQKMDMSIIHVQFLGHTYQLMLKNDRYCFTVFSHQKYAQGTTIPVYINQNSILQF